MAKEMRREKLCKERRKTSGAQRRPLAVCEWTPDLIGHGWNPSGRGIEEG